MRGRDKTQRGLGPFTGAQLMIVIIAICAVFAIPTAGLAAGGAFTNNSATVPAVKATNTNAHGIGVQGTGKKYGVYSNGPLGVAAGKPLSCTGCVGASDIAPAARNLSDVWSETIQDPVDDVEVTNVNTTVASVSLPAEAATYLVNFTVEMTSFSDNYAQCALAVAGQSNMVLPYTTLNTYQYVLLADTAVVSFGGTLSVVCSSSGGSNDATAYGNLTALRVGTSH
jgi:hypothetical protein